MSEQYLVLFDADHIKDYVFATGRLKEIRGASEQVRQLTNLGPLLDWCGTQPFTGQPELIYAGGAAGALLFAHEDDAQHFCNALPRHYRRTTHGATLSAIYVAVVGSDAEAQERAAQVLARRKASRMSAEAIVGGGYLRFCDSDRLHPASDLSERDLDIPRGRLFLSASTRNKRRLSPEVRRSFFEDAPFSFWQPFRVLVEQEDPSGAALRDWRRAIDAGVTQDLGAIGAQARPEGYIALVYADGDGIGNWIRAAVQAGGFDGYRAFSQALSTAAVRATAFALQRAYPRPRRNDALPFEIITIGGDDILLICTADRAFSVAADLSQEFATAMTQKGHAGVTASIGVVIAHESHPIVNLRERAGELLRRAKDLAPGSIDFHIVSTPGLESITTVRAEQYAPAGMHRELSYTARPYRREDLEKLRQHALVLRRLPASKRAELYYACLRAPNRVTATLAVLQTQIRLDVATRGLLLNALRALGADITYPFLLDSSNRYVTPLLDLLEVAEFVREE